MTTTTQLALTIDLDNVTQLHVQYPQDVSDRPEWGVWIWQTDKSVETHCPEDRCGGPYHISDFVSESEGDKWFIFSTECGQFMIHDLVRGDSWEDAYENFVEWATTARHLAIDEIDLPDYGDDYNITDNGTPYDADGVRGCEVRLIRVVQA